MSYASRSGRAETDPSSPRAFGVCDRCGMWYNLHTLNWQREWAGSTQINLHILVCSQTCLDELQPQLRTIILPADPAPIINARIEPFSLDETDYLATEDGKQLTAEDGTNLITRMPNPDGPPGGP